MQKDTYRYMPVSDVSDRQRADAHKLCAPSETLLVRARRKPPSLILGDIPYLHLRLPYSGELSSRIFRPFIFAIDTDML